MRSDIDNLLDVVMPVTAASDPFWITSANIVAAHGDPFRSPVREVTAVVFESSFDSRSRFDPVPVARALRARLPRPPRLAVAMVAPTLEIPAATQHALAYETGLALDVPDVRVVTASDARRYGDGAERALAVVEGETPGQDVDPIAAAFAHAYLSRQQRRIPFRCTPLQRRILDVVAAGTIVPTTAAIAAAVYSTEKKVSESIAELVAEFCPGRADGTGLRDGHQRLYWLMHRFGAWLRLVNGRIR
ncbi:hypothetical protein ACWDSJ_31315 [Nocardia sp. NPDC003482]